MIIWNIVVNRTWFSICAINDNLSLEKYIGGEVKEGDD